MKNTNLKINPESFGNSKFLDLRIIENKEFVSTEKDTKLKENTKKLSKNAQPPTMCRYCELKMNSLENMF